MFQVRTTTATADGVTDVVQIAIPAVVQTESLSPSVAEYNNYFT